MNIFSLPALPLLNEMTTLLEHGNGIRVERIISTGHTTDWYDQEETEFVVLLEGTATLEYESGETLTLTRGDTVTILPHQKHRVAYTSTEPPCVWLCVFW